MALQGNLPIGSAILPGTYWRVQEFWWEYGKGSQIFCRVHTYPTAQDAEFIQHPAEYEEKTYPTGEIDPTLPDDDPNRYLTETVRVKVSEPWVEEPKPIYQQIYTFDIDRSQQPPQVAIDALNQCTPEQAEALLFMALRRLLYDRLKAAPDLAQLQDA